MDTQDPSDRTTLGPRRDAGRDSGETEVAASADLVADRTALAMPIGDEPPPMDGDGVTLVQGLTSLGNAHPTLPFPLSLPAETFLADLTTLAASADRHLSTISEAPRSNSGPGEDDPLSLATSLVDRGVLTIRQADAILSNRGQRWSLGQYSLGGKLGQGGMGVVYEAHDRDRNATVALKILQHVDTSSLHRFKREFRAHADLSHPNLIKLYELFAWDGRWFFTMERVHGDHFREALRTGVPGDFDRVRALFGQLATGMMAIHAAGLLHRDIKPSNVLVRPDDRVVILDFGLVTDLEEDSTQGGVRNGLAGQTGPLARPNDREIVGTIEYMSPEQASGQFLTAASDWYSVGVLLYEVLAGRRPFTGRSFQVLRDKQRLDPSEPLAFRSDVPRDLNDLCMALLDRRPEARPSGAEVLDRLGQGRTRPEDGTTTTSRGLPAFVGRKDHLDRLAEVYEETKAGTAIAAFVSGPSGAGKSTLVAHFLRTWPKEDEAVLLSGRCFEQESVPFKAVDGIAEALASYLRRLPPDEAERLLPESSGALPHIFPALGRVDAIDRHRRGLPGVHDPQEMRRRAFAAFRGLLARIAARRVVVLAIDDLQWGDLDSALLLVEMLLPPDPPRILLLGTYRSEFAESGACLKTLRGVLGPGGAGCARPELMVEPLDETEARELAAGALSGDHPDAATLIEAIVHESRGDPFAIVEMARQAQAEVEVEAGPSRVNLGGVIWSRIDRLGDCSRRLLEVVALAGRPLPQRSAYRAAGLEDDAWGALMALRDQKLAISNGLQLDDEVVTSHDRVREAVVGRMDADTKKKVHRRLALALESSGTADPGSIAAHFLGADETDAAGDYYEAAADRAAGNLAFDRAAKLYDLAHILRPLEGEVGSAFRLKHAEALANAGRSGEAGQAYLQLAVAAREQGREAGDLFQRSAYQFTIGGRIDDGRSVWRTVLSERGIELPTSSGKALRSLIGEFGLLKLRGLRFKTDPGKTAPPEALEKVDLLWSAATGLSMIDPISAHLFRIKGLRIALRSGDPKRIAIGLASYATILSYTGTSMRLRVERLLEQAREQTRQCGDPHTKGMIALMEGFVAFHFMQLKAALTRFEQAEAIFAGQCRDVIWESDTCRLMKMWTNVLLGDIDRAASEWEVHRHSAFERGNLYAQYTLQVVVGPGIRMARDEPEEARREMREVMAHWSRERFQLQHLTWIETEARLDRYVGDGPSSLDRLNREWKTLKRSMAFRSQLSRSVLIFSRSLAAVMVARISPRPRPLLDLATRGARSLVRERWPVAEGYAETVLGAVSSAKGDAESAIVHFSRAIAFCEAHDMMAPAACARRKIGELLGGDEGRAKIAEADEQLQAFKVKDPVKFTRMMMS